MKRKHLAYPAAQFPEGVVEATTDLFNDKPWREENDFYSLANFWARKVATAYEVEVPAIISEDEAMEFPSEEGSSFELAVPRSLIRLFVTFGTYLNSEDKLHENLDGVEEARRWGFSLFYVVKPKMFRQRVREGRIHLDPYAIFTSATEAALKDYDVDPTDPHALSILAQVQADALADTGDAPELGEYGDNTEESNSESSELTHDQLRAMNTRELRRYATSLQMTGTWSMNKDQLLTALGVPVEVR